MAIPTHKMKNFHNVPIKAAVLSYEYFTFYIIYLKKWHNLQEKKSHRQLELKGEFLKAWRG